MSRAFNRAAGAAIFFAAFSVLCLLVCSGSAAAHPRGVVHEHTDIQLDVRGTHGYEIELENIGDSFLIFAERGPLSAVYIAKGRSRGDGFDAGLGKLGHIALRFKSSHRRANAPRDVPRRCGDTRESTETGVFTGRFEFRGERDYTEVSKRRIKGSILRYAERVCKSRRTAGAKAQARRARQPRQEQVLRRGSRHQGRRQRRV